MFCRHRLSCASCLQVGARLAGARLLHAGGALVPSSHRVGRSLGDEPSGYRLDTKKKPISAKLKVVGCSAYLVPTMCLPEGA